MRQGVITSPTTFAIEEVSEPTLQSPGDIILQTATSGICSGDLMEWYLERKVNTVLGHEVVGNAVEVGASIDHIRMGQLVFAHHHAPCMECRFCRAGDHVQCATWRNTRLDPGGMAEFVRVPAENVVHDAFAIDDLDPEVGVFIEPLGCSVKAVRRVVGFPMDLGVVVGCGVMGLLNLACARALGARTLWAVEPDADRRRKAEDFAADRAFEPEELADLAQRSPAERADFVIVGPGSAEAILQAFDFVRDGGVVILFTPTPVGVETAIDLGRLYFRDVRIVPSYSCGPNDTREAADLLRRGAVDVEPLVTHRFALCDLQSAYDTAKRGGSVLKVLVNFDRSSLQ